MAEQSPEWKKPSDVMKLRRRSSQGPVALKTVSVSDGNLQKSSDDLASDRKSQKRKNPFASSQVNIRIRSADTDEPLIDSADVSITDSNSAAIDDLRGSGQLNRILDFKRRWTDEEQPAAIDFCQSSVIISPINQRVQSCEVERLNDKINESPCDTLPCGVATFPLDWSLKTKVRYLSSSPFDWCTPLRGVDESKGVENFVRDLPLRPREELENTDDATAKQQSFQRCTMYWIHPNVPWLQTFPRISRSLRQAGQVNALIQNEDVNKALYNDWCDSMNSVFMMVRHGVCPYFYVCCHNMTLLFRAAGIVRDEMHAIITPTTRGLRAALDEEGVEFSLPLLQTGSSVDSLASQQSGEAASSNQIGNEGEDAEEDDENLADDSAASIWLLDLGLDQKRYRSVDPSKVRDQRDIFRQIDYRPVSTVLVEGVANTQALFNYMLNCNICFATTGSQAGLPPTILSPTAFRGATLQSLKVRQGSVSEQIITARTGYRQQMYTVEATGPVLPLAVAGLSRLFASTSGGSFTASFAVHDPTTPLNCIKRSSASGDDESASRQSEVATPNSHSSPPTRLDSDVCHTGELGKEGLRELICCQGLYTWTSN